MDMKRLAQCLAPESTWQMIGVLFCFLLLSLFFILNCNNNDNHFAEFTDSENIPAVDLHSAVFLCIWSFGEHVPLLRAQRSFQFKILNNLLTSSSTCRAAPPLTAPTSVTGHTCSSSFPASDQTHTSLQLPQNSHPFSYRASFFSSMIIK